jgi:hypothetical protein
MATLHFECRGQWFEVDKQGRIKGNGLKEHSDSWLFLGTSRHHRSNSIDISLGSALLNPNLIVGGLVWDKDHGTTRRWGGSYAGKLPRVTAAYIK